MRHTGWEADVVLQHGNRHDTAGPVGLFRFCRAAAGRGLGRHFLAAGQPLRRPDAELASARGVHRDDAAHAVCFADDDDDLVSLLVVRLPVTCARMGTPLNTCASCLGRAGGSINQQGNAPGKDRVRIFFNKLF